MEFQHTDKVKDLLERVTKFMDDHVYEGEKLYADQMTEFRNQGNPWQKFLLLKTFLSSNELITN